MDGAELTTVTCRNPSEVLLPTNQAEINQEPTPTPPTLNTPYDDESSEENVLGLGSSVNDALPGTNLTAVPSVATPRTWAEAVPRPQSPQPEPNDAHQEPNQSVRRGLNQDQDPATPSMSPLPSNGLHGKPFHATPCELLKEWRIEIFTWLVGTLAVVLIIVLLAVFKGKLLLQWKGKVQISTIIAILSQLAQSALLVSVSACIGQLNWIWLLQRRRNIEIERFDEASRGPAGSIKLFFQIITRSWKFWELPERPILL
jgi:hypothetical protein